MEKRIDISFSNPKLQFKLKNWNLSNSKFVVGYAGLHGNFQNLNTVLDACKLLQLKNSKIHIVLVEMEFKKNKKEEN